MRKLIALLFVANCFSVSAQTQSISSDSIVVNLTITNQDGVTIETPVTFENANPKDSKHATTNKLGNGSCTLSTGENYIVRIPDSDDNYEYNIPEFSVSPVQLNFKFSVNKNSSPSLIIRILNNNTVGEIGLIQQNSPIKMFKIVKDAINVELITNSDYVISAKGVTIKNNVFKVGLDNLNDSYVLNFTDNNHAEFLTIKNSQALVNIILKNNSSNPVPNETIFVKSDTKDYKTQLITNPNGVALAIIPKNDQYHFSFKYFKNVCKINSTSDLNTFSLDIVRLNYPTSIEYEAQIKSDIKKITSNNEGYFNTQNFQQSISKDTLKILSKIFGNAGIDNPFQISLGDSVYSIVGADVKFFEKKETEVTSVLNRNKNKWVSRMIVSDVSIYMFPFLKDIAWWHMMEFTEKSKSDYVFFNDGNNVSESSKIIGKIGGIYPCLSNKSDSVIPYMFLAMQNGREVEHTSKNVIEALLLAQKIKPVKDELILIADYTSPVKDMKLLNQIVVPVRVVLCGSKNGITNTDYLDIAYKTRGSIHTNKKDITNLSSLKNGNIITIEGTNYKFMDGYFKVVL